MKTPYTTSIFLELDLDIHEQLAKIQRAEAVKFNKRKRRKDDLLEDIIRHGMKEFVKIHELEI